MRITENILLYFQVFALDRGSFKADGIELSAEAAEAFYQGGHQAAVIGIHQAIRIYSPVSLTRSQQR